MEPAVQLISLFTLQEHGLARQRIWNGRRQEQPGLLLPENRVGWVTFLFNETWGNQPDISSHLRKGGEAYYILAPVEPAVQLISLLCRYLLQ